MNDEEINRSVAPELQPPLRREGQLMSLADPTLPARVRQCTRAHQYGVYSPLDDKEAVGAIDFVPVWTGDLKEALLGILDARMDGTEPILAVRHAEDYEAMRGLCKIEAMRVRPEANAQRLIAYAQTKDVILSLGDFVYLPDEDALRIAGVPGVDPKEWIDAQADADFAQDGDQDFEEEDEVSEQLMTYLIIPEDVDEQPCLCKRWDLSNKLAHEHYADEREKAEIYVIRPGDTTVHPARLITVHRGVDDDDYLHYNTTVYVRESMPLSGAKIGETVELELHSGGHLKGTVRERTLTTLRLDTGGALSLWHISAFKSLTRDVQVDEFSWTVDGRA